MELRSWTCAACDRHSGVNSRHNTHQCLVAGSRNSQSIQSFHLKARFVRQTCSKHARTSVPSFRTLQPSTRRMIPSVHDMPCRSSPKQTIYAWGVRLAHSNLFQLDVDLARVASVVGTPTGLPSHSNFASQRMIANTCTFAVLP